MKPISILFMVITILDIRANATESKGSQELLEEEILISKPELEEFQILKLRNEQYIYVINCTVKRTMKIGNLKIPLFFLSPFSNSSFAFLLSSSSCPFLFGILPVPYHPLPIPYLSLTWFFCLGPPKHIYDTGKDTNFDLSPYPFHTCPLPLSSPFPTLPILHGPPLPTTHSITLFLPVPYLSITCPLSFPYLSPTFPLPDPHLSNP